MHFKNIIAVALSALLVACGGGEDTVAAPGEASRQQDVFRTPSRAALPAVTATQTQILVSSDPGDWVGNGGDYAYTQATAAIRVTASGGALSVDIQGDENWRANFVLPASHGKVTPGTFNNVTRWPFHEPAVGGMDWSGEGRGCNELIGAFRVNSSEYVGAELVAVDLDFVQHCEGDAPALFGNIRWFANDPTVPPGPMRNVPDRLWSPAPDATPATGTFVYLESAPSDFVGDAKQYTYTPRNSHLSVTQANGALSVGLNGDEWWTGNFKAMNVVSRVRPGWYRDLQRWPFHNPVKGGLDWSGDGRGCNQLVGWFAVDEITYVNGQLATLDMRFEQRCQDVPWLVGPLRGRIRWDANDSATPPGPRRIPERLWEPQDGATPAAGNYVYLASSPGDYIGGGSKQTYTTGLSVTANQRALEIRAGGYTGNFVAMDSIPRLKRGFYPGLQRWPFHNAALGGMNWSGNGRGCNQLTGWFAVDQIRYDALGLLMALDMRFAQRCENVNPPLFGEVHWARPAPALQRGRPPTR
jgi:hypothetical protein